MSTHSMICFQATNGEVSGVYCHFDGYYDGVGHILLDNYQDPNKIRDLIALGRLSSLNREVGEKHLFNMDHSKLEKLGWTTAYHRDRGEELSISKWDTRKQFDEDDDTMEYTYLWMESENRWYTKHSRGSWTVFTKSTREDNEDEED